MQQEAKLQLPEKPAKKADKPRFGPASAIFVTLGAYFGSQILVGILVGAFITLTNRSADDAERIFFDTTGGRFAFFCLVQVVSISLVLWFMKKRRISLSFIGLGRLPKLSDAGYAFITFGIYFVLAALVLAVVGQIMPSINLEQEQQIGFEDADGGGLALVFITLVVLPPLVEEIMIRGFLYSGLRSRMRKIAAALTASFVFGIAHLQLGTGVPPLYVAAIDTFVLSMVLIELRERTGSLWSGIFVHGLKNGLAFVALFVFV
jgi:membrane protease YdiL (CAAX protease family)